VRLRFRPRQNRWPFLQRFAHTTINV
jgi:hypothetical protein